MVDPSKVEQAVVAQLDKTSQNAEGLEEASQNAEGLEESSNIKAAAGKGSKSRTVLLHQSKQVLTDDVKPLKVVEFEELGLNTEVIKSMRKNLNWETSSPIQQEVIPHILNGENVVARAKTGTGKTGGFLLPILHKINLKERDSIEAIVLEPTRELSMQTSSLFISLSKSLKFEDDDSEKVDPKSRSTKFPKTLLLTGGSNLEDHINILKDHANQGIKIIVGTCGRVDDLIKRKALPLDKIKMIVLDEADKLLAQNFSNIENIINSCPDSAQKMLFSATYPEETSKQISSIVKNPKYFNIMDRLTLVGIQTTYCHVKEKHKVVALYSIFKHLVVDQVIIFVKTSLRAKLLCKKLDELKFSCIYINSKMPQTKRNQVFNSFKKNSHRILICTDIFERGIDNSRVNAVINFDVPCDTQHYLHRVGRAGRYGRRGVTIDMVRKDEDDNCPNSELQNYLKILSETKLKPCCVSEILSK